MLTPVQSPTSERLIREQTPIKLPVSESLIGEAGSEPASALDPALIKLMMSMVSNQVNLKTASLSHELEEQNKKHMSDIKALRESTDKLTDQLIKVKLERNALQKEKAGWQEEKTALNERIKELEKGKEPTEPSPCTDDPSTSEREHNTHPSEPKNEDQAIFDAQVKQIEGLQKTIEAQRQEIEALMARPLWKRIFNIR